MSTTIAEALSKTRFAMLLVPEEQNEQYWNVQYFPCGHFHEEKRSDIVARSNADAQQVAKVEAGQKFDAPIRG